MTRRRIIAGVILLAAVVVATSAAESVAYREEHSEGMVYLVQRWEWLPGNTVHVPNQVCFACLNGGHDDCLRIDNEYSVPIIVLRNGRISGLVTGRRRWGRVTWSSDSYPDMFGPETRVQEYPPDFRCTCTDPSHDGDSK